MARLLHFVPQMINFRMKIYFKAFPRTLTPLSCTGSPLFRPPNEQLPDEIRTLSHPCFILTPAGAGGHQNTRSECSRLLMLRLQILRERPRLRSYPLFSGEATGLPLENPFQPSRRGEGAHRGTSPPHTAHESRGRFKTVIGYFVSL